MKKYKIFWISFAVVVAVVAIICAIFCPKRVYTAQELGISVIQSERDADGDGIDDLTDLMLGARAYIETKPIYMSRYYDGGYPTDGYGVCTDVIWQAFDAAGYKLKDLVDADIQANLAAYPDADPDPNIDFRRVCNLDVFFSRWAQTLPTDTWDPSQWQAGDIVTIDGHITICSDKRNRAGIPYLIHHASSGVREADDLSDYLAQHAVVGHYRWIPRDTPLE